MFRKASVRQHLSAKAMLALFAIFACAALAVTPSALGEEADQILDENQAIQPSVLESMAQESFAADNDEMTLEEGAPIDLEERTVYVSRKGKYHFKSDCSGMKNYTTMSLSEAVSRGYEACQTCATGTTTTTTTTVTPPAVVEKPKEPTQAEKNKKATGFTDVAANDWVYKDGWLTYVVKQGLMQGSGDKFTPNGNVTRGQVVTILYRYMSPDSKATFGDAKNQVNTTPFTDNKDGQYYTAAVNWAYDMGIMRYDPESNPNATTKPEGSINRAELSAMLYRFAVDAYGIMPVGASSDAFASAPDAASVPTWAQEEMGWCVVNKILSGDSKTGKLSPMSPATRAQMAKMITVVTRDVL